MRKSKYIRVFNIIPMLWTVTGYRDSIERTIATGAWWRQMQGDVIVIIHPEYSGLSIRMMDDVIVNEPFRYSSASANCGKRNWDQDTLGIRPWCRVSTLIMRICSSICYNCVNVKTFVCVFKCSEKCVTTYATFLIRIMHELPWITIFGHEWGDLPMIIGKSPHEWQKSYSR